jgi:prepilin-type N-terminal cleavage/methylation domain-containing protein|tara:strand:+ start:387 stop:791 length:405 start_codon:yes stop_codon:yes gene_type:complete
MKKTEKNKNGFTMIEIMVVVVIIAILAAFAVPIYIDYVESARASEAKSVISSVSNGADMFYQTSGEWPTSVDDLEREGQLDLKLSTKAKWQFELQLPELINATSTEEMAGGAGKSIQFNRQTGKYTGYGSPDQE